MTREWDSAMVPSAGSCGWVPSPSLAALNSIKHRANSITKKSREIRGGGKTFWLKYQSPPIRRNNVAVRLACGPLRPGGYGRFLGVVAQPWTSKNRADFNWEQIFVEKREMICKYRAVAIVSSGLPRPVVLASHL